MEIWVAQDHWGEQVLQLVVLGDWTIEQLIELFPNAIYFYAELVMSE